jgi:hypothetical protein
VKNLVEALWKQTKSDTDLVGVFSILNYHISEFIHKMTFYMLLNELNKAEVAHQNTQELYRLQNGLEVLQSCCSPFSTWLGSDETC